MNEHTKLIADLQLIQRRLFQDRDIRYMCAVGEAIEALRGIQPKTVEPKIDADAILRNQFAGLAMQGLVARDNGKGSKFIAECAFDIASAMVAESKK